MFYKMCGQKQHHVKQERRYQNKSSQNKNETKIKTITLTGIMAGQV